MRISKQRILLTISLLALIPVGLYSKVYAGPAANWVNNSLVGVWYVVFWCLLGRFCFEQATPWAIAITVLTATCAIEFLQVWHPPLLTWLRSFFIGRIILGTGFTWLDFPYYMAGAAMGWLWLRGIQKIDFTGNKK
jgi:hypothetical protein